MAVDAADVDVGEKEDEVVSDIVADDAPFVFVLSVIVLVVVGNVVVVDVVVVVVVVVASLSFSSGLLSLSEWQII